MKRHLLIIWLAILPIGVIFSQNIHYVKWNAPGMNDGSDWQNAFRDLQDALDTAQVGDEVWIAEGTYYPGGFTPDTLSTFTVSTNISIYGGFAGTESSKEERDVSQHPTRLSGDVRRDDLPGDFVQNRTDNVRHVVSVVADTSMSVMFDGLAISGGHTSVNENLPFMFIAGGGINSDCPLTINNCLFEDNFGWIGGCVSISESAQGPSLIQNSIFQSSGSAFRSAGIYLANQSNGKILDCVFRNNQAIRGACYLFNCIDIEIRRCVFENNVNTMGFGGAFYNWNCINTVMDSCSFNNNEAVNAGAMYIDGRDSLGHGITITNSIFQENTSVGNGGAIFGATSQFTIENCEFMNNEAGIESGGRGAAIYGIVSQYVIESCVFMNNEAGRTGGGIHSYDDQYTVKNSRFSGNSSTWGPAITTYREFGVGLVQNCLFESNMATTSGGATSHGFKASVTYEDCAFMSNTARIGGAMFVQDDTTKVSVYNSEFTGNVSTRGGAFDNLAANQLVFEDCLFFGNYANFGGALNISDSPSDLTSYEIKNCIFDFNIAEEQGGGINVGNANGYIENSLFINNIADGEGRGGAISINASGGQTANTLMMNCTVADNIGNLASGIAQWTDGTNGTAELQIQNNMFYNSDGSITYAIEDGSPTVFSSGGNVGNESSLTSLLTHPLDILMDPIFVDPFNDDYHLDQSSPGINAGVSIGAPQYDLDGNMRDENPDAGAYEFQGTIGVGLFVADAIALSLSPNPTAEHLVIQNPYTENGNVTWVIVDIQGKPIKTGWVAAGPGTESWRIQVNELQTGHYYLLLNSGEGKASGQFQKY